MTRTVSRATVVICVVAAIGVSVASVTAARERTVVIPAIGNLTIDSAYQRLHDDGLLVSIPAPTTVGYLRLYPIRITPRPGTRVHLGAVVSLHLGCRCGAPSIGTPKRQLEYRVPSFIGKSAAVPSRWVKHKPLVLNLSLGPLRRGDAQRFLDNFRVESQEPAPGTELKFSTSRGIITPLHVTASQ